jgi:hypothetical protein
MLYRCLAAPIVAIAVLCGALAGPVSAQTPPSPAAVALAREILQVKGSFVLFEPLVPGVVEEAKNALLQTNINLGKQLNEVAGDVRAELGPRVEQLKQDVAKMYAERFTEQELKDALAFFKSPLGKKILEQEPQFVDQSLDYAQNWANQLSDEALTKIRAGMRKKGHNL